MAVGVIIAVRGSRESAVAAAVGGHPDLAVARRCADLTEALAAAHAGVGMVVVVSDQPQLDRSVVAEFVEAGVAVVGVPSSSDGAERLGELGVDAVLSGNADVDETAALVARAAQQASSSGSGPIPSVDDVPHRPRSLRPRGAVIAVWGPTGAPGRTTIAVNLAYELAARHETLLVDADTYGGGVAQALALLDEAPGVAALARASLHGSLDDDVIDRHALEVAPRLRVLSGITRADRWPELSGAALAPVWEALRLHAQATVVDCGFCLERDEELQYDTRAPQRNGATLSALAAADVVVAVGSGEPLSVQRLVNGLAALDALAPREGTPRTVVVNRVRASVAGSRPAEAVADALRKYSAVEQIWTLPFDPKACDAATLAGQALAERAPRSPLRRGIESLAGAVAVATALS